MAHPGQCLGCLSILFILLTVIFGMIACWSKEWYVIETDQESEFKTMTLGLMLLCKDQTCDFYSNNNNFDKMAEWSAGKCDNKSADLQAQFDSLFTLAFLAAIFFFVGFVLAMWSQMRYHWKPLVFVVLFLLLGWIFALVITVGWLNYVNGTLFCPGGENTRSDGTTYTGGDYCWVRDHAQKAGATCTNSFGFSIVMGVITAVLGLIAIFLVVSTACFRQQALRKLEAYREAIGAANGNPSGIPVDPEIQELYEDEEWEKKEAAALKEEEEDNKRRKKERLERDKAAAEGKV